MPSVIPVAWKKALLAGRNWKVALYVGAANLNNGTLGYSTVNEIVGAGYSAGGKPLVATITTGTDGIRAVMDFVDTVWTAATITGARYALVYDDNLPGKEGFVLDFGVDQSVSAGTFTIIWPAVADTTAIYRIP